MVPLYDKYIRHQSRSQTGYGPTSVRLGGVSTARKTFPSDHGYDWRLRDDESQAEDLTGHASSMDQGSNSGILVTKDVTVDTHAL